MILMKLLPLIPAAQLIVWPMLGVTLWLGRDLVLDRLRRDAGAGAESTSLQAAAVVPPPVRRRLRWKVVLLSGLAATELVLMLAAVTA